MKRRQRIGALVCVLALAMALLPQRVAADPAYGWLVVGNVDLCEEYGSLNQAVHPYTDNSAVYDPANNTLTLTDYNGEGINAYLMGRDFRIVLVGSNTVTGRQIGFAGLDVSETDVHISGSGSLTCNGINLEYDDDLEISGSARVTVNGADNLASGDDWIFGLHAQSLTLRDNCRLTVTGGDHLQSTGSPDGDVTYGVWTDSITVSGSAKLTARGGRGSATAPSIGIRTHSLEITSGTVDAAGTGSYETCGIYCPPDNSGGTPAPGNLTISGGNVTARGATYALSQAPDLSGYARYRWKTGSSYTDSDSAPYVWSNAQTYVEITAPNPVVTGPTQAETVNGVVGSPVTMTIRAANVSAYQWQIDRGSGWGDIPGATDESYTTAPLTEGNMGYRYRCVVSGVDGSDPATSEVFTLRVVEQADIPPAGDSANPLLWLCLLLLAGAAMACVWSVRKKRRGGTASE